MKNLMGLIYTGENDTRLRELTLSRAVAALPVIGRYRIIDFQLSSLVNSGVRNVGVITQRNYHSLMDHLGSGKEWDLHGKKDGLFILPPFLTRDNVGVYEGSLDAMRSNLGYLRRSRQEYIALIDSSVLYNIDFVEMLTFHIDSAADITVLCRPAELPKANVPQYRIYFDMNGESMITNLEIEPEMPYYPYESLSVALLKRELLLDIVLRSAAQGLHSFESDVLRRAVNENSLRVAGYVSPVRGWHIDSVQAYYQFNMDALYEEVRRELFHSDRPVYTKVRDDMPTRYGANAVISNSLIADGGKIDGTVENSIIFRGVTIDKEAAVRNSIIMQDAKIQSGAEIDHCILDKQAVITAGGRLIGPSTYPIVISKNVMI